MTQHCYSSADLTPEIVASTVNEATDIASPVIA